MKTSLACQLAALLVLLAPSAFAEVVELDLTISREMVNFTGEPVSAMTVNGGIPGPTLRFTEGDTARIEVRNEMDVDTSIHWHGILVPPGMDGVPNISFPPIAPGESFIYEFPIRQNGTYWYHSHTMLQEQLGVYGSIVILPKAPLDPPADEDHVVLFSDWIDKDPHEVLRTLRRGSEWYALEKGSAQSIFGAARLGMLGAYFSRELQRMPAMDIADIAYDRFLANGQVESSLAGTAGKSVRLRLINGSATTFFHTEFAGGPMTVVAADGIDVEPFEISRLLIAVAETYDVVVRVPTEGAYELRGTAHDASGFTSTWMGEGDRHWAPDVASPNLYHSMGKATAKRVLALTPSGVMGMPKREVEAGKFDQRGMAMGHGEMGGMEGMNHGSMDHSSMQEESMDHGSMDHGSMQEEPMDHGSMDHGSMPEEPMDHGSMDHGSMQEEPMDHSSMASKADEPMMEPPSSGSRGGRGYGGRFGLLAADLSSAPALAMDGGAERPWSPYEKLRARGSTRLDADLPVREVRMTLDGDMERYVWFLNGKPLARDDSIRIEEGEVVRFIMINRTMMHHPMHLHGHFFRVLNDSGDRSPLKHTVNVEPMSTTVIEFEANEVGDWFFHCHLLYHMESGMARVVEYEGFISPTETSGLRDDLYDRMWFTWADLELMSHRSTGMLTRSGLLNDLDLEWEAGWQDVADSEWEATFTWSRYRNRFFKVFVGADIEGDERESEDPRAIAGFDYLLPFQVESRLWVDSEGEARAMLERAFQLTPRIELELEAEYDTEDLWEGSATLGYMLSQQVSLLGQWHSDNKFGAGLALRL